jgi:hypothetical protein
MNGNKFLVNEDQGVQYIYERAEVEAAPKRKPLQKALLTLGFLGLTAGASAAAIGQFATGISNQASAETEIAAVAASTSAQVANTTSSTTASAAKPATITLPAATTKSFGSTSHSTQKGGTSKAGNVSFGGENESEGDD